MADVLCAGVTHHPGFMGPDDNMAGSLYYILGTDKVPADLRDPRNWPPFMQKEWGDDRGLAAAARHRDEIVRSFRAVADRIRAFNPDFIVIWGDDQYEQFREDCVPPFSTFIFDKVACQPYLHDSAVNPRERNAWGEPLDKIFECRGHYDGAAYLTQGLIDADFDIAYAYNLRRGEPLPHSFLNTVLYLDYDRTGFDIPIVPFHVNCYGSTVIRSRGAFAHLTDRSVRKLDPSSPPPRRCFDIGRATARILRDSPFRVVLMASSSWSHGFLTKKNGWLYPDAEADRLRFEDLRNGRYGRFRELQTADIEEAGQQELLNWVCLAGALEELGGQADYIEYIESYLFNSNKCMAVFSSSA